MNVQCERLKIRPRRILSGIMKRITCYSVCSPVIIPYRLKLYTIMLFEFDPSIPSILIRKILHRIGKKST